MLSSQFRIGTKKIRYILLVHILREILRKNPLFRHLTMVTLATAGGPSQSPPSPLTPHIPEQSWKEPPPPFLTAISTQNCHLSNNIGRSTLTHVVTYRPPTDTIDSSVHTTMDNASLTPPAHAISALLPSPPSLEVDGPTSTSSFTLPAFIPITRRSNSRVMHRPTSQKTTTTHYTSTLNTTKTKKQNIHHHYITEPKANRYQQLYRSVCHPIFPTRTTRNRPVPDPANPASFE